MFFMLACFKVDGSARSVNKFDTVSWAIPQISESNSSKSSQNEYSR